MQTDKTKLAKNLKDVQEIKEQSKSLLDDHIKIINSVFEIDLRDKCRKHPFVVARALYYKIATKTTKLSLESIGNRAGGRDHATVINGLRTFDRLIQYPEHGDDINKVLLLYNMPPLPFNKADANYDLRERIIELENELKFNQGNMPQVFKDALKLPKKKLEELMDYRMKPFLIMNAS